MRSLNLNDNYVGEEGALALAEALAKNTAIRELQLKGNEMGDKGVKAICDAMKVGEDAQVYTGRLDKSNVRSCHSFSTSLLLV